MTTLLVRYFNLNCVNTRIFSQQSLGDFFTFSMERCEIKHKKSIYKF